jgi:hypothetical protein
MVGTLIWRTMAVVLSGLTMGLTFAHVLELPQRLQYDAELWTALTRPNALYRYFGIVGGPIEVAAVVGVVVVAATLRRRPAGRLALVAAGLHIAALAAWVGIVAPANAEIGTWRVDRIPQDWATWRTRWEAGHAIGFALVMPGFCLLVLSLLREHRSVIRTP